MVCNPSCGLCDMPKMIVASCISKSPLFLINRKQDNFCVVRDNAKSTPLMCAGLYTSHQ